MLEELYVDCLVLRLCCVCTHINVDIAPYANNK